MPNVFVTGSINMDLVVSAARLPVRGETVPGSGFAQHAGGKGSNQAIACAKLGARTFFYGKVGADAFGVELRAFLGSQGVSTDGVGVAAGVPTGTAVVLVESSGENAIIVIPGANAALGPADVEAIPLASGDIALAQFEVPSATVEQFFSRARQASALTILNPSPAPACSSALLDAADVLVVNETELGFFLGESHLAPAAASTVDAALRLRRRSDQIVVVTLGSQGAIAVQGAERHRALGLVVEVRDTTGAGDTFVGALAAGLSDGMPFGDAFARANVAAALSVQRHGASVSSPTRQELDEAVDAPGPRAPAPPSSS